MDGKDTFTDFPDPVKKTMQDIPEDAPGFSEYRNAQEAIAKTSKGDRGELALGIASVMELFGFSKEKTTKFINMFSDFFNFSKSEKSDGSNNPEAFGAISLEGVASRLGIDPAIIRAIGNIESDNGKNRKPRFEQHKYDFYINKGFSEEESKMLATSYGKFQIMGFNYKKAGYSDVQSFVEDMESWDEKKQLLAFQNFVEADPKLHLAMKDKDLNKIAYIYNGKNHADNDYVAKLETHLTESGLTNFA